MHTPREVEVERRTDDRATPTRDESVLQNYLRGVQWLVDVPALHQELLSHVPCAPDRITWPTAAEPQPTTRIVSITWRKVCNLSQPRCGLAMHPHDNTVLAKRRARGLRYSGLRQGTRRVGVPELCAPVRQDTALRERHALLRQSVFSIRQLPRM
jgi:hypothetical protein